MVGVFLKIEGLSHLFDADFPFSRSHAGGIVSFPSNPSQSPDDKKDSVDIRARGRSWA